MITEAEFIQQATIIIHNNGCRAILIDPKTHNIEVECPPGKDTECAQALADILGECEDIEEVKKDEAIKQVKENIGWII